MNALSSLRWSHAWILQPVIVAACYMVVASQIQFFDEYSVMRLSQTLYGLSLVGPLMGGWGAWHAGTIAAHTRGRSWRRSDLSALIRMLLPGFIVSVAVFALTAAYLAGAAFSAWTGILVLLSVLALLTSTAVGVAVGYVLPKAVAAPVVMVALFMFYAFPLATDMGWLRGSNTASVLASCCTTEQQPSASSLYASALLSVASIVGAGLAILVSRRSGLASVATMLVAVVGGLVVAGTISSGGQVNGLAARETDPVCRESGPRTVCLWPEHEQDMDTILRVSDDVDARLTPFAVRVPVTLSESPLQPEGAVNVQVPSILDTAGQRFAIALSTVGAMRCSMPAEELLAWTATQAGLTADQVATRMGQVPSSVGRVLEQDTEAQRDWVRDERRRNNCA